MKLNFSLNNLNLNTKLDYKAQLAKFSYKKLIYPAILLVVIVSVCWSFYLAAQFLGTSITNALSTPTQDSLLNTSSTFQLVNMADYQSSVQKVAAAPAPSNASSSASGQ